MRGPGKRIGLAAAGLALAALACGTGTEVPATVPREPTETPEVVIEVTARPTRTPEAEDTEPPEPTEAPEATATERPTQRPANTEAPKNTATPVPQVGDALFTAGQDCDWQAFALDFEAFEYTEDFTFEERDAQQYIEVPGTSVAAYAICEDFAEQGQVAIEVAASNVAGPNTNNVSLVCRYQAEGWYEGAITSGGYWYLYKFTPLGGYEQLDTGGSLAINLKRATNLLRMVCVGETISFYVNEVELGSVVDDQLEEGGFGISVSTFDIGGAGVLFEGLEVTVAGE
jgi:hypothetical protein